MPRGERFRTGRGDRTGGPSTAPGVLARTARATRVAALLGATLVAAVLVVTVRATEGRAPVRTAPAGRPASGLARSAVLFIGDGMGPAYVTVTRVARGGSRGALRMDRLPYTALSRTYSADSPVTDSAAAATAMACGQKTVNGVLDEDASAVHGKQDGARLESIALWAKKRGLRVGLVTTTTVTHATPAAFYAVEKDRDNEAGIARQAVASRIDVLLGGGRKFFPDDLRALARSGGWTIVETEQDLDAVATLDRHVLGLFAEGHLPYQETIELARNQKAGDAAASVPPEGRGVPTLPEMTRWAVDRLKRSGLPFLPMVEGGRLDHAGHANWARTLVDETAAFDESVGIAVDRLDPKTTLVLVTADHETGGLALNGYPDEKDGLWSTYRDPQGDKEDAPYPVLSFTSGPGTAKQSGHPPHGPEDPRPSGIPLASAAHTGVDVALYAWGAGAERVHGTLENTEVYRILREHLEGVTGGR